MTGARVGRSEERCEWRSNEIVRSDDTCETGDDALEPLRVQLVLDGDDALERGTVLRPHDSVVRDLRTHAHPQDRFPRLLQRGSTVSTATGQPCETLWRRIQSSGMSEFQKP